MRDSDVQGGEAERMEISSGLRTRENSLNAGVPRNGQYPTPNSDWRNGFVRWDATPG